MEGSHGALTVLLDVLWVGRWDEASGMCCIVATLLKCFLDLS